MKTCIPNWRAQVFKFSFSNFRRRQAAWGCSGSGIRGCRAVWAWGWWESRISWRRTPWRCSISRIRGHQATWGCFGKVVQLVLACMRVLRKIGISWKLKVKSGNLKVGGFIWNFTVEGWKVQMEFVSYEFKTSNFTSSIWNKCVVWIRKLFLFLFFYQYMKVMSELFLFPYWCWLFSSSIIFEFELVNSWNVNEKNCKTALDPCKSW